MFCKSMLFHFNLGPVPASYYRIIRRLAQQANLPIPKVYIIPPGGANAFATGRSPQNAGR